MSLKTHSFLCWMFFQSSQQEAIKQKEELMKEVGCLRSELHQVRDERDHTLAQETCSSQREQIQVLQHQLAAANEKLKMADLTAIETITEYEGQKKTVKDLQDRLADAEPQILEAEKLRKKLHNTILELKGNIRVFCRVRPVLPGSDCGGTEGSVVSYPTSLESLGTPCFVEYALFLILHPTEGSVVFWY
ncbi:kinesin-like protein KIN-14H isoform X2 [Phoenix dactylifera]|uniref:Kinesin-like protein KIN-14H isoform X2 n=1 Tax=Phoenix dactylifera TaxID=42345 RepID=A0A8B9AFL3_PHODC|nr:kinesin-like protein KIN-14H isoform X2 [Phoenix dactylifera]